MSSYSLSFVSLKKILETTRLRDGHTWPGKLKKGVLAKMWIKFFHKHLHVIRGYEKHAGRATSGINFSIEHLEFFFSMFIFWIWCTISPRRAYPATTKSQLCSRIPCACLSRELRRKLKPWRTPISCIIQGTWLDRLVFWSRNPKHRLAENIWKVGCRFILF